MIPNIKENAKHLKHSIEKLNGELDRIKEDKCVDYIQEDSIVRSYDKRKYNTTRIKLLKNKFEFAKINYIQFKTTLNKVELSWQEYLSAISDERDYIESQNTIRIMDEEGKTKWIPDKNRVNEMANFINSEKKSYKSWIEENKKNLKKVICDLASNKVIQFAFCLVIFILVPIFVNYIVTKPAPIDVTTDNDWIGFWSNYIGSIFSAFVGGLVAFYISKWQIGREKQKDVEDRIIKFKMDQIPSLIDAINSIKYLLVQEKSYFKLLKELEVNSELLSKAEFNKYKVIFDMIDEHKSKIFDSLDNYTKEINRNRVLIYQWAFYANSLHRDILDLVNFSEKLKEEIYSVFQNAVNKQHEFYSEYIKKKFNELNCKYDSVEYSLYSIENDLQNYLGIDIHGNTIDKMSKNDYFYGRSY